MYFYFTRDFKADLRYIFRLKTHQNDHLSLKFLVVLKEFSYKKTYATDFDIYIVCLPKLGELHSAWLAVYMEYCVVT